MKTLLLLRHAKSAWGEPDLDDFDRPLAPRGRKAAEAMGRELRRRGWRPDLVLCSTAVRARQTWALAGEQLDGEIAVEWLENLYLAPPRVLLASVRRCPEAAATVLLVGHNPGMEKLALALSGSGDQESLVQLDAKYPTAGLARIAFQVDAWADVAEGGGTLEGFVTPKTLAR